MTAFSVKPSEKNFSYWIHQDFLSTSLRDKLSSASVLLVPQSRYGEYEALYFPAGTDDFFNYLKDKESETVAVDICIEDGDFQELSLHSDIIILPELLVTVFVAPVITGLIVNYITFKLGSRFTSADLKTKITVAGESTQRSVSIDYEGKAADFDKIVGSTLRLTNSLEALEILEQTENLSYEERIERLSRK